MRMDVHAAGHTQGTDEPRWQFGGTATDVVEVVLGEGVARITGSVIDARGEPAPGAQIVLVPQERWRTDLVDRSPAIADQYGRFALENIPPGNYTLFAWAATEEIEPLNPEYIRQFEEAGLVMKLAASSEIHVDISVIPGRTVP